MHTSLSALAALPPETRVCCGHEYTVNNGRFAAVVEPGNLALRRRIEEAQAMRDRGLPTLPSTLADELAANPFLRVDAPEVRAALRTHLAREPADSVEAFAELRRWKDGFVA
jgi:hydroxyacylglutathione hydrolase